MLYMQICPKCLKYMQRTNKSYNLHIKYCFKKRLNTIYE